MRLLLCSVVMALCSTRNTHRVAALPTDFSLIKGNKGIAKLSAGKNLADAQRELYRNFRNPLMYANAWPVAQWDAEMRLSATPNRVLTLLLQAASANAYVFISSKACEIAKNTARRAKFLLDNPRHGDVSGKYAVVFTFHLLAQLERYVTVNLKVMWRNCERRFTSLAEMREWRGDAWDFNDPNETGIIGWCEFEGSGGVGGYIGSGKNIAADCACHAMGVANPQDATLVITVDSGLEVDGPENTDLRCDAESLVKKESKDRRDFLELLRARTNGYEVNEWQLAGTLPMWYGTAQCTEYLNRWSAVINGLTPQVISMAKRLTSLGYTGYRHIRDAASWAAIAPEDQVDLRERMAADFEDSSLRDELLSFFRATVKLMNDPAVLSCFRRARDEPQLPFVLEMSRAMYCYLRDAGELPEGAVHVVKGSRYFVTVEWLLPVLDLLPSSVIRIKAEAGLEDGESRRGMISDGIEAQALEAAVDQAILVAAKLDADLSAWLRDYVEAGTRTVFPEIEYLRHVTPHSRARVPDVWLKARREKRAAGAGSS